jgi:hypothetical protein
MKKPGRILVTTVTIPFLTACFAVLPAPIPAPPERESADIRGVVMRGDNGAEDERVEFAEVLNVEWMDGGVVMVGLQNLNSQAVTREFRYEDLSGVLQRQLDPTRTSILIGGVMVAAIGTIALIINGSDPPTNTPGSGLF